MEQVDINSWKRFEEYDFFSKYSNPYMGFIFKVDITNIIELLKENKISFYGLMTYLSLKSMNDIEEFKYSYYKNQNQVCKFDNLMVSNTILKEDNTFGFSDYILYDDDLYSFMNSFEIAKRNVINKTKTRIYPDGASVYVTCVPWFDFEGFYDAYNSNVLEASPKLCWGKYIKENDRYYIHYSVAVNHAFQDGIHVGSFINNLNENIQNLTLTKDKRLVLNGKKNLY